MTNARKFLLRWRFDFNRDRPTKRGMWSHPGPKDDFATKAWCNNAEGLVCAAIEGKNIETRELVTLVECDGADFRNFAWIVAAPLPGFMPKGFGSVTPISYVVGLRLLTRDKDVAVYDNGTAEVKPLTEGIKAINFATFGK